MKLKLALPPPGGSSRPASINLRVGRAAAARDPPLSRPLATAFKLSKRPERHGDSEPEAAVGRRPEAAKPGPVKFVPVSRARGGH